jgi:hypothetical protein
MASCDVALIASSQISVAERARPWLRLDDSSIDRASGACDTQCELRASGALRFHRCFVRFRTGLLEQMTDMHRDHEYAASARSDGVVGKSSSLQLHAIRCTSIVLRERHTEAFRTSSAQRISAALVQTVKTQRTQSYRARFRARTR